MKLKLGTSTRIASLIFLVIIATLQFFNTYKTKLPYTSDTLFYKHIFYQFKGSNFDEARMEVLNKHRIDWGNVIENNIFNNEDEYRETYPYFSKRLFYPFTAFIVSLFIQSEEYSFLIPVYVFYLGSLVLIFLFMSQRLSSFLALLGTLSLLYFPPYIRDATNFMTDNIWLSFIFIQILAIDKYIRTDKNQWLLFQSIAYIIALLNRELATVMLFIVAIIYLMLRIKNLERKFKKRFNFILTSTVIITIGYFIVSSLFSNVTLFDHFVRTQNAFGYYDYIYSRGETILFVINAIYRTHLTFFVYLRTHILTMVLVLLGMFGMYKFVRDNFDKSLMSIYFFSAALGSYLYGFLIPVFNFRYYYPFAIGLIYFCIILLKKYYGLEEKK